MTACGKSGARITASLLLAIVPVGDAAAGTRDVPRAAAAPLIDGRGNDEAWVTGGWRAIDERILGDDLDPADFSGRYKLVWTPGHLFLLAEIADDVLFDGHPDPLDEYWNDDALEIFVDADASGGDHQFNYNAFAYHVALDNQAVDIGPFREPADRTAGRVFRRTFPEHVEAAWKRGAAPPYRVTWEVRLSIYGDDFDEAGEAAGSATPLELAPGQVLGFMVSWCDADDASGRQHFVGDVAIEPVDGDRNRGWIDAGVFERIRLAD